MADNDPMDPTRSLHKAAEEGDLDTAERLLRADPYLVASRGDYKLTPLHRAAMGGHAALAAALLDHAASADARDYAGGAPLHAAAAAGHADVAAVLLDRRADANARDQEAFTPLHFAARGGHQEVAARLLARGADPNAQSQLMGTPLHEAAAQGHRSVVELLLAHGGLANARSRGSDKPFTPWHAARQAGHGAIAVLLADHGGRDKAAQAVTIKRAAEAGYLGRLQVLLKEDPSLVSSRDYLHKRTPLGWAAGAGQTKAAEILLAHRAPLDARDKSGATPLDRALAANHDDLADLLRRRGEGR